jgi:pyridoxal phosphate enzyme (YggS family)
MEERFRKNLNRVEGRIREAEQKSGRPMGAVKLIAVTKYVDAEVTRSLIKAGCQRLGENRPQVLWEKAAALVDQQVEWHLIGHLQRNKVKRTIELTHLIHSVDSLTLLDTIEQVAAGLNRRVEVLLELNVSGDDAKHGFDQRQLPVVFERLSEKPHVFVKGLMGMAGLESDSSETRRQFASLREIAGEVSHLLPENAVMEELSMGMSNDFEIAIEEGATLVRIGSLLFE